MGAVEGHAVTGNTADGSGVGQGGGQDMLQEVRIPTVQSPRTHGRTVNAVEAKPVEVAEISAAEWTVPSWDEVVREHGDRVYRLAYRLSGNAHDAEDLTQETFIRVFRSLASYKPGTFEGWLHRITTNLFLDMVRRRSRLRMEGLPEDTDRIEGDEPSPEEVYDETHLDPDLQAALDELPPEFRAAVVLCDVEGLSYEEIGATLGVKLGTVRSRIHRGRQALRVALERRRALAREASA
ncbi:RNA polymerase, sigma 29 subunit, SigE [Actinokineospora terrae]|uniref:RNA polymerase, sigma 29 subunit, SigE n=2 Tax=Actinokineospora terrae TaxID=155974 RepID=A0A1H9XDP9_9PSEU|nr:RNA polymerase, sigma 29 subunit, SigE [Actinokineospora terrae]